MFSSTQGLPLPHILGTLCAYPSVLYKELEKRRQNTLCLLLSNYFWECQAETNWNPYLTFIHNTNPDRNPERFSVSTFQTKGKQSEYNGKISMWNCCNLLFQKRASVKMRTHEQYASRNLVRETGHREHTHKPITDLESSAFKELQHLHPFLEAFVSLRTICVLTVPL